MRKLIFMILLLPVSDLRGRRSVSAGLRLLHDRFVFYSAIATGFLVGLLGASPCLADPCEELSNLRLENTVISLAKTMPAGPFETEGLAPGMPKQHIDLPSHCRVAGSIHPTSDSDIKFEVWMPASGWNGRYQQLGNGGLAGVIGYAGLAATLKRGAAAAATDDGHVSQNLVDAEWAIGHPEKLKDYSDRAVHLTAKIGQALVRAYYSRPAAHTYFIGCSKGGQESLMEAQRYPEDFDGYLAGAPADFVNYNINYINLVRALRALPADQQLGPPQLKALSSKVLERCDALDGVKDGVLRDPRDCKFDPGDMLCKAGENRASCLTPAQAKAIEQIYHAKDAKTEARIANGLSGTLGTESVTWPKMLAGVESAMPRIATLFYDDPKLDPTTLDLAKVARDTAARIAPIAPDLSRARSLGGKIIVFHGWADPDASAHDSLAYFDAVTKRMGPNLGDFYRFFLVPGMGHCFGAPGLGANLIGLSGALGEMPPQLADADHDWTLALERWVEQGKAPDRMIATEFDIPAAAGPAAQMTVRIKSTRPVCVYPKRAVYRGSGPQSDAASFSCE